jgi:hypothetical protein
MKQILLEISIALIMVANVWLVLSFGAPVSEFIYIDF